jgi:hypothetical protein
MYVAHYKSVNSSKEFYSEKRETLNFPTQVQVGQDRYLLQSTYAVPSNSIYKRIIERAEELGIPKDVPIN